MHLGVRHEAEARLLLKHFTESVFYATLRHMVRVSFCVVALLSCGLLNAQYTPPAPSGAGSGTVTSVGVAGTANQITVTGTSPITSSGNLTLSIPTNPTLPGTTTATISGNASTATALAANPAPCDPGEFVTDIAANGALTCDAPSAGAGDAGDYEAVAFSTTPTFTCDSNTINSFSITLTNNVSSSTLASCNTGQIVNLRICQDGTGSRTFVYPTNVLGVSTISATASTCTNQVYFYDGTNARALGPAYVTGGSGGSITMPGSSSGSSTVVPPSTGGGTTTLPSGSGTLLYTNGSGTALVFPGLLSVASGKTFTASNTLTVTGTDSSSVAFGAGGTVTFTIASGAKALDTDAIASEACDTMTATATGAATTDSVVITPNADITAVTGYAPETTGGLAIYTWLTTNTLNIKVCNPTSSSITPGAVTLNWRVTR